jgi:hypothetical protein
MQKELKAQGANLGTFGPAGDGVDGKIGKNTQDAMAKYPDIAKKYGFGNNLGQAAMPAAPVTGARATVIQNQQAQNQVPESVGYDEVQRIVSLVHYR